MKYIKYIVCVLVIIVLGIGIYFIRQKQINAFLDNFVLEKQETNEEEPYQEEITNLKEEYNNEDVVGTLEILNTTYKVPVVQTTDNDYYLKHLPDKTRSFMGSIFLDYRVDIDNSKKLLIYGHNSKKYKMPFKILENYYDEEYLNNHKFVELRTQNKIRKYEIFSVYVATSDYSYMKTEFEEGKYLEHLYDLKKYSFFDIDVDLDNDSNILILQTCSTHKDYENFEKKYLIIALKEVN